MEHPASGLFLVRAAVSGSVLGWRGARRAGAACATQQAHMDSGRAGYDSTRRRPAAPALDAPDR